MRLYQYPKKGHLHVVLTIAGILVVLILAIILIQT
jgi:hypothetical protein